MIRKEDIMVGLRFYMTREVCLNFSFDPMCGYDDSPILFSIDRYDDAAWRCVSTDSGRKFFANFSTEAIMKFGIKYDTATTASVSASLDKLQIKTESEKSDANRFKEITDKMSDTYKRKNHDYGNAFSEMYDELGINYGYGKIREKVNRIKTLKDDEAQVANESLEDSLLDCANYCILTLMEYQKRKEHGTD